MTIDIHFHIGRRHLRWLPPTVATLVCIFCIAWWATAAALFLIAGSYVATAALIALVDLIVTWVRARRRLAAIARSVAHHPSRLPAVDDHDLTICWMTAARPSHTIIRRLRAGLQEEAERNLYSPTRKGASV